MGADPLWPSPGVIVVKMAIDRKGVEVASPTPMEGAQELQQMLVSYAKQETTEPLKVLTSYLKFGIPGAISLFLSGLFVSMGVLRLLQGIDKFAGGGKGSLVPYLGAFGALLLMIAMIILLMLRAGKRVKS